MRKCTGCGSKKVWVGIFCFPCGIAYDDIKRSAQVATRNAVKKGLLPSPLLSPCADCGGPSFGYDHRNYREPLKVEPICRKCNWKRGRAEETWLTKPLRQVPPFAPGLKGSALRAVKQLACVGYPLLPSTDIAFLHIQTGISQSQPTDGNCSKSRAKNSS